MSRYPEPHGIAFTAASMDMGITADSYNAFPAALTTTMGSLDQSLYGTDNSVPSYVLHSRTSPSSGYPDDGDMRLSSSGLSTASAPSAPSSVVGSPQSHTGHLGVPEWASMQPSIVGDYMTTGSDYPTFSSGSIDDLSTFDFTHPKSFVGEFYLFPYFSSFSWFSFRFLSGPVLRHSEAALIVCASASLFCFKHLIPETPSPKGSRLGVTRCFRCVSQKILRSFYQQVCCMRKLWHRAGSKESSASAQRGNASTGSFFSVQRTSPSDPACLATSAGH